MIAELDAIGEMVGSILSFARDDAKREARTLVDLDALAAEVCEDAAEAGEALRASAVKQVSPLASAPRRRA
jgi:hypothetical protein